jgi:hypothetical protein
VKLKLAGTVLLVTGIAATAAVASSDAVDISSTRAFIVAATRLESVAVSKHKSEEASANALIRHISSACPRSLSSGTRNGSVAQQATWTAFTTEARYELVLAQLDVLRPAYLRLIRDLKPLRWTDSALNRQIGAIVSQSRDALNLRPPDLCSETRTAAGSNFSVIPMRTVRFLRRARIALPSAGTQPTFTDLVGRMKRYTTPDEAATIRRLRRLEHRYAQLNSSFGSDAYLRIVKALSGV